MSVIDVVNNGCCVGCGNCTFVSGDDFRIGKQGVVEPMGKSATGSLTIDVVKKASKVCPFSGDSSDEDELAKNLYSDKCSYDKNVGFYRNVYVGWDTKAEDRVSSSSGGVTTRLIAEMFDAGVVQAAIVVSYDESSASGVSYAIANSAQDLGPSRQSKYILAGYGNLLREISDSEKTYVFVGVPCHVKAFRLLVQQFPDIGARVTQYVAVFCGHQKSTAFRDYIGWQLGVQPDNLKKLVYRVKKKGFKAHEYFYRAVDRENVMHEAEVSSLKWMDWGLGLFKLKACDYCDDVAGEVADVILGDAWMKPYSSDYRGNNLIITRSKLIDDLLKGMSEKGDVALNSHGLDAVFISQGANFRHRKEGLLSRIQDADRRGDWVPVRRPSLYANFAINPKRHALYVKRGKVSFKSHAAFESAIVKNDLSLFFREMKGSVEDYQREYTSDLSGIQRIKGLLKKILKGKMFA